MQCICKDQSYSIIATTIDNSGVTEYKSSVTPPLFLSAIYIYERQPRALFIRAFESMKA